MRSYFHTITEKNKTTLHKPPGLDTIYYSELNEWYTNNAFRSFSLKYVVDRRIYYKLGRHEYAVNAGEFLLTCRQPGANAYFDSKKIVRSVCIDICPGTIAEAFTVLTSTDNPSLDNYLAGYFNMPDFFQTVNRVRSSLFDNKLRILTKAIAETNVGSVVNKEWFMDLVERIIFHEYGNYQALNGIQSVKMETRKEILRRLWIARHFMDDEFLQPMEIEAVARVCNLSEFHFYRSFRQAFGISPYQYLLNRRLEHARTLLEAGRLSVTAVAGICNFPDIFTFSKAFKRKFNLSPSGFVRSAADV